MKTEQTFLVDWGDDARWIFMTAVRSAFFNEDISAEFFRNNLVKKWDGIPSKIRDLIVRDVKQLLEYQEIRYKNASTFWYDYWTKFLVDVGVM